MRTLLTAALITAAAIVPAAPAAAGGGGCHEPAPTDGSGTTVELGKFCISPTVLTAEGDTVTFVNRDPSPHNVIGLGWGDGELLQGESFTHTFSEPGTYPYACTLHHGMVGVIQVGERLPISPAAATTEVGEGGGSSGGAVAAAVVFGALGLAVGAGVRGRRALRT